MFYSLVLITAVTACNSLFCGYIPRLTVSVLVYKSILAQLLGVWIGIGLDSVTAIEGLADWIRAP